MSTDLDARKRIRTAFQAFVSACAVLLVVLPIVMIEMDGVLPDKMYAYLGAAVAAITAVASLVTRLMTVPAVKDFIDRFAPWLAAEPQSSEDTDA
ncbi:hypothetical protein ACFOOK_26215 [Micromonospora krabiensis]|uniref:Holin n=1 Tax=Micromonospora krabiensis TaxID=307121 RepID=A0A1C3N5U0_9ACTN|nr:hypothetical protein [Micromonospora krabiensis]SBV27938.1 hypothetical protein GA0070620_3469 [Micromonospora krabiensis]